MTDDKMLARIAALLRQAEGTDNAHEAEAFMSAAQRLATATSIDLAVARSHSAKREAAQTPTQRTVTIGEAGARGLRTYVQLFAVIAHANDVRCDVASNSTFVYAYGFAEDIDATHALYASLVVQMVKACDGYLVHRRAPPDPDHHRPAELPAGLRRPGRPTARRGARGGPPRGRPGQGTRPGHRDCPAEQGDRADATTTATRRRRAAPGGRTSATAGYSSSARRAGDRAGQAGPARRLPGVCRARARLLQR